MSAFSNELTLYDNEEYTEPTLDDSVFNPANNEYRKTTRSLRRMIAHLAITMRPKHAMIAKYLAIGQLNNAQIAKKMRCDPATVAHTKKRQDAREMMGYIRELQILTAGTQAIDREMFLWSIAMREQEVDPRTAIAAVAEINKMRTDTESAQAKIHATKTIQDNPTIIIQLADSRLLPSPLDNPQLKDVN